MSPVSGDENIARDDGKLGRTTRARIDCDVEVSNVADVMTVARIDASPIEHIHDVLMIERG